MEFNNIKRYSFPSTGGGDIKDDPFGPSWNGDSSAGASRNSLYDHLITIGAGFGNTAFVRSSGNDTTAIVGNYLLPFQTIGAAIAALGTLTNSVIFIDAGTYILNDSNAPFGLKAPGSRYDIIAAPNCNIEYYGTYGMYCADGNDGTTGSIYGYGNFTSFSTVATKAVEGVTNFAFNIGRVAGLMIYEVNRLDSQATSGGMSLMRVGASFNGNVGAQVFTLRGRMRCRTGVTMLLDTDCNITVTSTTVNQFAGIDSIGDFAANTNYTLQIVNPFIVSITNVGINARGTAFGNANTRVISLTNSVNARITFESVYVTAANTPSTYRLIELISAPANMNNVQFIRCILKNRDRSTFTANGASFFSDNNTSFKIIDTLAERPFGGAGTITNLISKANSFWVDANL